MFFKIHHKIIEDLHFHEVDTGLERVDIEERNDTYSWIEGVIRKGMPLRHYRCKCNELEL